MRQLKSVIFVLTGLFIMITLVSLLMPSQVMTARSVVVHAPAAVIFNEVADLSRWKDWHPLFRSDSSNMEVSKPSSGVNAFASWNTNGKRNKLLITDFNSNAVKMALQRNGEKDIENIISISSVQDSNAIQVEWRVLTRLRWYPWEKFYGIFVDKLTGPGYEQALNSLKEFTERPSH